MTRLPYLETEPKLREFIGWGRRRRDWADSTCEGYNRRLRHWLAWCEAEGIRPHRATSEHVRTWLDSLYPSPAVRTSAHTALIAYYDWRRAMKADQPHNPARAVERIRVRKGLPRSLEGEGARAALRAARAHGPRWACYTGLLFYAGLRRAEACAVEWTDFEGGWRWLRVRGKGGVEATVPVHDELRALVLALRGHAESPIWLFPGRDLRGPMCVATATKHMRRIFDEAGLPGATPHSARHTYGSAILEQTGDVAATQAALRHESLSATTIYVRARDTQVARAVAKLDYGGRTDAGGE